MDTSDGMGAARRDGSIGSGGEAMGPHPPGAGGREEMISEIAHASEGGFGSSRSQSHNSSSGKGGMPPPRLVSVDRAASGESKRSTRSTHGKAAAASAPKVERTTSSGSKKGPKVERTASSGSKKSASSGRKVKLEDDHDWVSKHMKIKIKAVGDILNHDEELLAMDEHLHEDLEATELTWKRHFEHEAKLQSHDITNRHEVEAAEREWQEAILNSPQNSLSSPRTKNAEVVQVIPKHTIPLNSLCHTSYEHSSEKLHSGSFQHLGMRKKPETFDPGLRATSTPRALDAFHPKP
jgi:hypothetical protein